MPAAKRFVYIPLTEERRFLVFAMNAKSGKLTLKHDLDLPSQPSHGSYASRPTSDASTSRCGTTATAVS